MGPEDRVLVPITYGFAVRYLVPTGLLEGLAGVCRPVVALGWDDARLEALLTERGVEVLRLPDARLSGEYRSYRRRVAILHERRLASPTTRIRRQRELRTYPSRDRLLARVRRGLDVAALRRPSLAVRIDADEDRQLATGTNLDDFDRFLSIARADAVLSVTPYHDQDGLLLRAAERRDIRSLVSVISFDNPTTRARMIATGDVVSVWNNHMVDQLLRSYPALDSGALRVIGAPQFDLHRRHELVMPRDDWLRSVGAPRDRPVVLYGASPRQLVPGEQELARALDQAISDGRVPGEPFLVVRPHPVDPPGLWDGVRLTHGTVTSQWATTGSTFHRWPDHGDLVGQMSALAHGDVHVNICSSMTLDGAMFDRPQIGPRFVPGASRTLVAQLRAMYRQEHWGPIARSGALAQVDDLESLVRAVGVALSDPGELGEARQRMLEDVLGFTDGASSDRLVEVVREL